MRATRNWSIVVTVLVILFLGLTLGAHAQEATQEPGSTTFPPLPADPRDLPNSNISGMAFNAAPDNCRDVLDMDNTCSSRERQPMQGEFDLQGLPPQGTDALLAPGAETVIATGDNITVRWTPPPSGYTGLLFADEEGNTVLYPELGEFTGTNAYIVEIANNGPLPLSLYYDAPDGSYHGFFNLAKTQPNWSEELMANIVYYQTRLMMVESDPAIQGWINSDPADVDGPYEALNPANCASVEDLELGEVDYCGDVNMVVISWDGNTWTFHVIGLVGVNRELMQMTFVDYSPVLAQLAVGGLQG